MSKTSFFSFFLTFLVTVTLGISFSLYAKETKEINYNSHLLIMVTEKGYGTCSGTSIAPNAFLTAGHCLKDPKFFVNINGLRPTIAYVFYDKTDHLIIVFKENIFKTYSQINPIQLKQGQDISFIGNPGNLRNMFRNGYVSGVYRDAVFLDMNSYHGDSGSGIYDTQGKIRCVVSEGYIQISPQSLHMQVVICYGFTFTKEQKTQINLLTKQNILL